MLKYLVKDLPFVRATATYLNRISILSISIGVLLFIKCLVDFSYISLLSMVITIMLFAAARIFAAVMLRAAYLKEHSELVV